MSKSIRRCHLRDSSAAWNNTLSCAASTSGVPHLPPSSCSDPPPCPCNDLIPVTCCWDRGWPALRTRKSAAFLLTLRVSVLFGRRNLLLQNPRLKLSGLTWNACCCMQMELCRSRRTNEIQLWKCYPPGGTKRKAKWASREPPVTPTALEPRHCLPLFIFSISPLIFVQSVTAAALMWMRLGTCGDFVVAVLCF